MCDLGDCLAARSSLALALQAYRTLPKVPAGPRSQRLGIASRREAVNKAELIQALSAYYDGSKSEAAKALNAVVETITYKTAAGEKVSITGFGVFEKVPRSARMVRNPRTGERKRAKATAVPRFRAGTDLKAYVSGAKKVPRATAKKASSGSAAASKTAVAARKTVAKAPAKKTGTTAKKTAAKR
jgi:DNA-binding protein HU-beta